MKKSFLIFTLLLFTVSVFYAQKLRDESLWIKYVQLPPNKLPDDYLTYSSFVSGQIMAKAGYSSQSAAKSMTMDGFKRVPDNGIKGGHLRLVISTGSVSRDSPEFKSKTTKSKTKDGKEVSKTTYYYLYGFQALGTYTIYNADGEQLFSESIPVNQTYESPEFSDASALRKQMNKYFNEYDKKFAISALNSMKNKGNSELRSRYDYQNARKRHELYVIKKHASEDQWEKHYNNVKDVFETSDYATSSDELLQGLNKSIEYYEMQGSKNPRENKKLKRIYEAAHYNLALIYTFTDQLDKALEHANMVLESEGKDTKTKRLIEFITSSMERMNSLDIHTLHHYRALENAMPPHQIAAMEEEMEELSENTNMSEAVVYLGNEEFISGTITLEKDAEDLIIGEGGNVKFILEEEGEIKEINLCADEVTGFAVGDRTFMKMNFAPSAKGKEEASIQILEEVYSSEKINVYKYYPCSGALSADKPELALKKAGEENPISLESTQFLLWDKGLSQYFGDCEELKIMCEEGGLEKTLDDMIKAARIYAELCE